MRYIDLSKIDSNDPEVVAWNAKAANHLVALSNLTTHDERSNYLSKHPFWGEFKPILLKLFGNKCWYSECSIDGSFGDVDHFRPKNKSANENGKEILTDGYWWLAYDYENYRLSCEKCNRRYNNGGKGDCFPVNNQPAVYPQKTDDNLLLDPCNPDDYYLIDSDETGAIIAMSSNHYDIRRVEVSKKVYNWKEFNEGRKRIRLECKTILERFEIHYNKFDSDEMEFDIKQIKDLIDSKRPYSSFAKKYIYRKISGKPYKAILNNLLESNT